MKILFILLSVSFTSSAFAQNACYDNETNVKTKKAYSEDQWNMEIADWGTQEPKDPGVINLFAAWKVYKNKAATVKKIKGDKRKHCYMGCRIAQDVSLETAIYVAWLKENDDLTDCEKSTLFEHRDFEVTVEGAELSKESSDKQHCLDECSKIKKFR